MRFWRSGAWRIVVVDDYLPCDATGWPCFALPPSDNAEIWRGTRAALARGAKVDCYFTCSYESDEILMRRVTHTKTRRCMLAEKAFAKLNGSYEMLTAGQECEALSDLTGGAPFVIKLHGEVSSTFESTTRRGRISNELLHDDDDESVTDGR